MKKLALVLALISLPCFAGAKSFTEAEIESAASTFKFKGEWISPKLVKEFLPWISDHPEPMILAVDAARAPGSNRYFGDIKMAGPNKKWPTVTEEEGHAKGESISYDYIGRLKNGMHVLVTYQYGQGTMVDTDLIVFSLKPTKAKNDQDKDYLQLVMKLEREVGLGDRAIPEVELAGNIIHVKSSFNGSRKPEEKTIQF